MSDRDKGKEAVEAVLGTFYRNIGTPAPAPGIERLAFLAVEASRKGLREEWEEELLSDEANEAVVRQFVDPDAQPDVAQKMRDAARAAIEARLSTLPTIEDPSLPRSTE